MRNKLARRFSFSLLLLALAAMLALSPNPTTSLASSHREAPLIVADPLADNTDTYAFRSTETGRSGFVTLIGNWIPFQEPSGGPHFYKFDDTVLYEIYVDNTGDGVEDVTYQFRFKTTFTNPDSILGMAAPNQAVSGTGGVEPLITSLDDPDYNEPQTYSVTRIDRRTGKTVVLAKDLLTPPNNIGERTTPNYENTLGQAAVYSLPNGGKVFAGQRDEGFYIDVGGVFDTLKLKSIGATNGVDSTAGFNVSTIAIEVPIQELTRTGAVPGGPTAADAVVGVWATSSRQKVSVLRSSAFDTSDPLTAGPYQQVSRLGSPLVNELIIPLKLKDSFNRSTPAGDSQFGQFVTNPQLAQLLSAVFGITIPATPRNDLVAIFATGIPVNDVTGPNFTTFLSDGRPHEMLRLNVAIGPSSNPSRLGLLGGDVAGFPNGRRVFDDVVDISLRAVAGGTPFTPATNISPNNTLGDGVANNDVPFLSRFPYLGIPQSGNSTSGAPHQHHTINALPALP
ncbi:MAG TPA: DUF4331 domain-containing protein [Pyrinomonadaceae bacterium]|jgi:hypothetical protein|nr:DUF4331 domain-containing protein [Pyrinomonadaceae bacterium]